MCLAPSPSSGPGAAAWSDEARYCASKLLNLMHVRHLARELPAIGVVAFNPSVVSGTEIGRDRNWLQRLGWKYLMPLFVPILPGARGLGQSAGDLLWLISEADAARLSGQYVDGRVPRPGSRESHDPAKITRAMEVARTILDRLVEAAGTRAPACGCPQCLDLASSSPLAPQGASFIDAQHPSPCLAPPKPTTRGTRDRRARPRQCRRPTRSAR